jgi:hypothetical protein
MLKENVVTMEAEKEGYDFTVKPPNAVLTQDERANYGEGMRLKNKARPADQVDFTRAAQSTAQDLDRLLS